MRKHTEIQNHKLSRHCEPLGALPRRGNPSLLCIDRLPRLDYKPQINGSQ